MYRRIMTSLDSKMLRRELQINHPEQILIADRIDELIDILADAYGDKRGRRDFGGYILYFPNESSYSEAIVPVYDFYNISDEDYEYRDVIGKMDKTGVQWHEDLFLLGSDDSLVMIYPKEAASGK